LWRRKTSEEVERAFKRIRGVGRGIASMVVLLLEKVYGVRFGDTDHRAMNVKPDVHVIRVLSRLGVLDSKSHAVERSDACDPRDATGLEGQAIAVTRRMHPEYPALLDTPLWMIGRMWCHAQAPACPACPVLGVCPRHGVPAE
jgi:endonuclease III